MHGEVEAYTVHVVEEGFAQSFAEFVVVGLDRVFGGEFVAGEGDRWLGQNGDAKCRGIGGDGAVSGEREAVPESRLDTASLEKLSDHFQRVDGFQYLIKRFYLFN